MFFYLVSVLTADEQTTTSKKSLSLQTFAGSINVVLICGKT